VATKGPHPEPPAPLALRTDHEQVIVRRSGVSWRAEWPQILWRALPSNSSQSTPIPRDPNHKPVLHTETHVFMESLQRLWRCARTMNRLSYGGAESRGEQNGRKSFGALCPATRPNPRQSPVTPNTSRSCTPKPICSWRGAQRSGASRRVATRRTWHKATAIPKFTGIVRVATLRDTPLRSVPLHEHM